MLKKMSRNWKDAATVLLASKSPSPKQGFDYEMLLMQRSSKSKFMPNAVVFPGGICDKSDFSTKWLQLFSAQKEETSKLTVSKPRPQLFHDPEYKEEGLHPELGFRITAIRETFEESGVALFRDRDSKATDSFRYQNGPNEIVHKVGKDLLSEWREKVDRDANKLFDMCIELNIVPDIWSLKTWSNWLTPVRMQSVHGKSQRRYDTIFYIYCLPYRPDSLHDDNEIVSSHVSVKS